MKKNRDFYQQVKKLMESIENGTYVSSMEKIPKVSKRSIKKALKKSAKEDEVLDKELKKVFNVPSDIILD